MKLNGYQLIGVINIILALAINLAGFFVDGMPNNIVYAGLFSLIIGIKLTELKTTQ